MEKRNSNIELLRIISMFFILTHHFVVHSNFSYSYGILSYQKIFLNILAAVGKLGVDIFIVISSYFLIDSKLKLKKVYFLFMEVTLYSVVMYVISSVISGFSIIELGKCCLPFLFNGYWFATTYIVFYLSTPILNIIINGVDKKQYVGMLAFLSLIWVILPTFTGLNIEFSNLLWFIYLFFVVGFIKKYQIKIFNQEKKCKKISIISFMFIIFSVLVMNLIGCKFEVFSHHSAFFSSVNKLPAVITSVFLFFWFLNRKKLCSNVINTIAKTTFGIYLIHDHKIFSEILWNRICKNNIYFEQGNIFVHYIIVCSFVFCICIIIDIIRIKFIDRVFEKLYNYLYDKMKNNNGMIKKIIKIYNNI